MGELGLLPRLPLLACLNMKSICVNVLLKGLFFASFVQAYEACGPMEIDSALTAVQTLRNELQDAKMAAIKQQLKPLPGESVSGALLVMLAF